MIDELTDKIAAADQPHIAAACRSQHLLCTARTSPDAKLMSAPGTAGS
jgi:hypothetical protein